MKLFVSATVAFCLMIFALPKVDAGDVTVKKAHVCCGACVNAVKKCLADVEGVSKAAADQNSKIITFTAADDAAATKGIAALAKAGFHGAATHGDKALEFPKPKTKAGEKTNSVTFTGVHLCCGACVRGAKESLENVKNVKVIDVDQKTKTVTLTGEKIDLAEAIKAFNGGGFHGNLKGDK
ncbi:MAG: heavy-metal-associated domain-containing protein [Planctomycetaceae bacterium]|nr:heavy-metal-associated domain-containing protein [Planctomycetaceae bacterium]